MNKNYFSLRVGVFLSSSDWCKWFLTCFCDWSKMTSTNIGLAEQENCSCHQYNKVFPSLFGSGLFLQVSKI